MAEYVGSLELLASQSDVRSAAAEVIASHWATLPSTGGLLDYGCGDGQLVRLVVRRLNRTPPPEVLLLDSDPKLLRQAVDSARSVGLPARVIEPDELSAISYAGILLSHVVYYIDDLPRTLAPPISRLHEAGRLTIVIRSESCDTYALRQLVRSFVGQPSRITLDRLREDLHASGLLEAEVDATHATARVPCSRSEILNFGRSSQDLGRDSLEHFVKWMARLNQVESVAEPLRGNFVEFLMNRFDGESVVFSISDVIMTCRQ